MLSQPAILLLLAFITTLNASTDCSTNYTTLEVSLLNSADNSYRLSTTFSPPRKPSPLYVNVYYYFEDTNISTHYVWSSASFYIVLSPRVFGFLSLFFSFVDSDRITKLSLILPHSCSGLDVENGTEEDDFLEVLTQRVTYNYTADISSCTCIAGMLIIIIYYMRLYGHVIIIA